MHLGLKRLVIIAIFLSVTLPWTALRSGILHAQVTDQENELSEEEESEDAIVEETAEAAAEEVPPTEEAPVAEEDAAEETEAVTENESSGPEIEENNAYVSADDISDSDDDVVTYLKPYRERRTSWGSYVSIGYSAYSPEDYNPSFVLDQFGTYYGAAETPLIELTITPKKNLSFGSLGLDIGIGYYENTAPDSSELTLIPARLGLNLSLDTLFREPYVVPYGTVGAYLMAYREAFAASAVSGNTAIGIYYSAGLRFQLDWVDSDGDYASYDENGMENTFVYVEARSFLAADAAEPDISSPADEPFGIGAGFSLEF